MVIVFDGGNRVLNKEAIDYVMQFETLITGIPPNVWMSKSDYQIYGDDLKIEIRNSNHSCVFCIKDYDESLELESEIRFSFDKKELNQLISVLSGIYERLEK